jgi:hypothetical protein
VSDSAIPSLPKKSHGEPAASASVESMDLCDVEEQTCLEQTEAETESSESEEPVLIRCLPPVWKIKMENAHPAQWAQFVRSLEAMVESHDQEDTDEVTEHEYISYTEMVVAIKSSCGPLFRRSRT